MEIPIGLPGQTHATAGLRALLDQLDAEFGPVGEETKQEVDAEFDALFGPLAGDDTTSTSDSAAVRPARPYDSAARG